MINNNTELQERCAELKEYQRLLDEINAKVESLKDEIKDYMGDQEEIIIGQYKIRWSTVHSTKFNSNAMKNDHPEIYESYTYDSTYKRFSVN